MYTLLSLLAYAALALTLLAFLKPQLYPLKNPNKFKASGFYFCIFVILFVLSGAVAPQKQPAVPQQERLEDVVEKSPAETLAWTETTRQRVHMPATGRDRLLITLIPDKGQEILRQRDLLDLAMLTAMSAYKESAVPIIVVRLLAAPAGDSPLAQVIYIPDGKGYDGTSEAASAWETFRAAKRGFTAQELEYMRLWSELFRQYQSPSGLRTQDLDAAISEQLGIPSGSLQPFANAPEDITPPNGYLLKQ